LHRQDLEAETELLAFEKLVPIDEEKGADDFERELFSPSQMQSLAQPNGLAVIVTCSNFNATREPNPDNPRVQLVLARRERILTALSRQDPGAVRPSMQWLRAGQL